MAAPIRTPRDLGDEIRRRRRAIGWSQQVLADRAGVGRPWLSQVEGGKRTAEIGRTLAVLDALGAMIRISDAPPPSPTDVDLDGVIGTL